MSEEVESSVLERYSLVSKMGRGAYGVVWKAQDRKTSELVALKKVFDAFQNSTDAQRTYREVMYLQQLNGHENIIRLISIIRAQNNKDLYLVFDLMETDLHNVIRAKILKPIHKTFVLYQLFKVLKFIHSSELIHRDLKPSNMLINSDCLMKLADFGLARSVAFSDEGEAPVVSDYIATRWYRAPEILLGSQQYSKAVDIWSAGCILAETLLEKVLFPGKSSSNQLELIIELLGPPSEQDLLEMNAPNSSEILGSIRLRKTKSISATFSGCPPEAVDLVRGLLAFNPNERMTASEVLAHPYFSRFHNEAEEFSAPKKIIIPIEDTNKLSLKAYRDALYEDISRHLKHRRQNSYNAQTEDNKDRTTPNFFRKKSSLASAINAKQAASPGRGHIEPASIKKTSSFDRAKGEITTFKKAPSPDKAGLELVSHKHKAQTRSSLAARQSRENNSGLSRFKSVEKENLERHSSQLTSGAEFNSINARLSVGKQNSRAGSCKREESSPLVKKNLSQGKAVARKKEAEKGNALHRSQNVSQPKINCFFKKKSEAGALQKTFTKNTFAQLLCAKKSISSKSEAAFLDKQSI